MKKALIITYYWPPSGGAGVQRWLKFVKYLRQFQWEPIVYCPEGPEYPEIDTSLSKDIPEGLEVLRYPIWEPYEIYKRFIGRGKDEKISAGFLAEEKRVSLTEKISIWVRGNLFIPDARKFWIAPSVKYLSSYLATHPVDVIISTGPPHSCHLIARQLKKKFNIPWVADFRDPWTNIDFYQDLMLSRAADRKHHRLEKAVLMEADAVIAISPGLAEEFQQIYPREIMMITNGYDEDDMLNTAAVEPDKKFSLVHIGSLVPARNPHILWTVLEKMITEDPGFKADLEIKLVGKVDYTVRESLEKAGLTPYFNKVDYIPHDQVAMLMRQSMVLLLLVNQTPNAKGILTGKFFEYLGARRPILAIGPANGDLAAILKETEAGFISDFDDIENLERNLRQMYQQYKSGTLKINSFNTSIYSRKSLTGKLADVMNRVISAGRKLD